MSGYFNIQSPFTQLADQLYSRSATARSSAGRMNDIVSANDPLVIGKLQSSNRGVMRSPFAIAANSGAADVARRASGLQQSMSDQFDNAQWATNKAAQNEGYANDMLSRLFQNQNVNNDPGPALQMRRFASSIGPQAIGLGDPGLLAGLFGGF